MTSCRAGSNKLCGLSLEDQATSGLGGSSKGRNIGGACLLSSSYSAGSIWRTHFPCVELVTERLGWEGDGSETHVL